MAKADGVSPSGKEPRAASPERVAAFRTGVSAEARAAVYLMVKGYRILARRFRTPQGEIDIVARRRNILVFVEVRPGKASMKPPMPSRRGSKNALSTPLRSGCKAGWWRIPNMRILTCVLTPC